MNPSWWDLVERATREAYHRAGVGPGDMSLAEVHDCFTISEVFHYETLGFAKRGEAAKLFREKSTYLGGKVPFSVSGGLLAKGHPPAVPELHRLWRRSGSCGAKRARDRLRMQSPYPYHGRGQGTRGQGGYGKYTD